MLKSVSGFEMYRKRFGRMGPNRIVEFLLMDRDFPRAVHYCIHCADECVHAITGNPRAPFCAPPSSSSACCARSSISRAWRASCASGLHEFLDGLQGKMNTIDTAILEDFFEARPDAAVAGSAGR